jgi:16S rRNA (adenine1518-N6/adenine1519-N6)-dimethyltransferase
VCDVAAKDFYPAPQVDSAVVKLIPYQLANPAQNPRHLETLIKLGFSSRRKMLRNNLKTLMDIDRLAAFLREIGMREDSRAEDLGLEQWIALSNCSITDGIIKE